MGARALLSAGIFLWASCITGSIGDPSGGDPPADAAAGAPDGTPLPPTADAQPPIADAAPPPDAQPCVEGDLNTTDPTTGTCYMYFAATVPWDIALASCASLGGHLAVSTAQAENNVLAALGPAAAEDVWMGGDDLATEGVWVWITSEPMTYTYWRDGEPNNADDGGENCMVMEVDNLGTWDDRNCGSGYTYFCER